MLYPLFFEPVYKNIIWGGRNLEKLFNRSLPAGNVAESWDICCHKNGMSLVTNGTLRGKRLDELIKDYGTFLVGKNSEKTDRFPILIKLIDANDKLSIQVHPGNDYALKTHGDFGKTEMWYVIHAKPNAKIIYGAVPGTSKEDFKNSILNGSIETMLNYVNVKKDDIIFIPSGTIHGIMDGLIIAEIQQNSDTTYRVYDWNRVDANGTSRELHIERALDVINFDFEGIICEPPSEMKKGYSIVHIIDCEFFKVDKIIINTVYNGITSENTFLTYTCIEGNGFIEHDNIRYDIKNGSSFMLPATMGDYKISGNLALLKSYI